MKELKVKNSSFERWLSSLLGGREYFKELSDKEVLDIMIKIAEIAYARNPVLSISHTPEEAALINYSELLYKDRVKFTSNSKEYFEESDFEVKEESEIDEYCGNSSYKVEKLEGNKFKVMKLKTLPYFDEKSGKFYEYRRREQCKGFEYFKESNMTVEYFCNIIFRIMKNQIEGHTRRSKFKNTFYNTVSLEKEIDDNRSLYDTLEDTANSVEQVDDKMNIKMLSEDDGDIAVEECYSIKIDNEVRELSYGNLMYLYSYLADGSKLQPKDIIKHIIHKATNKIVEDKKDVRFIHDYISSFKKYLLESGSVNVSIKVDSSGKEKKIYGFA